MEKEKGDSENDSRGEDFVQTEACKLRCHYFHTYLFDLMTVTP